MRVVKWVVPSGVKKVEWTALWKAGSKADTKVEMLAGRMVDLTAGKWAVAKAGLLVGMWVGPKAGLKAAQ